MARLQFTKRTTAVLATSVVLALGTVGVVAALGGDGTPSAEGASPSTSQDSTTSSAGAHSMGSHDGGAHDMGSHDATGSTGGAHDMGSHDATGSTGGAHDMGAHDAGGSHGTTHDAAAHNGGHDPATHDASAHDGGHDATTGTAGAHNGGHDSSHGNTSTTGGSHSGGHSGGHGTTSTTSGTTCTTTGGHTGGHSGGHGTGGTGCPPANVIQYADLPADVQAQVDLGTAVALAHPTTAEASADGWTQATIFFPGIAAHYLKAGILDNVFDPANPEVLLYGADGQLVGFNYIVYNGATPPEGFPGSDDVWHQHPALCRSLTTGLIIGGEDLDDAACAAIGGVSFSFAGFYLLHVWNVPGYTSPEGIFSHENSLVK